ncbi:Uncharacterized protein F54H12.2 [Araneus ventricosus]|uniref:Uncharacterized protein F54H12.2 n=1 Tax=Araneus ventricosus TaxID=182803 RepID=A0A4Y2IKL8_ARAVE|nr:Uncharacterized protein F54H12.2 [Araneus ventricosus]
MNEAYQDPKHVASFGGVDSLYPAGEGQVSKKAIQKWLQGVNAYTLHKPVRKKFRTNRVIFYAIDQQRQADLGEWEVGIVEFIYLRMWNNVTNDSKDFEYNLGNGVIKSGRIACGYYETPIDISNTLPNGSGEDYIDLSATQLHVKAKLLKDNAKLGKTEKVAPLNLLPHSLYSQVDVSLNDRLIYASSNLYSFRSYIETFLNYGTDYQKSFLTCEGFYKDTAGRFNETDSAGDNDSLKKRASLIEKSKVLDMIGNLYFDIFYQDRLLLNLVNLKMKLIRRKPEFCLVAPANGNYKVIIEHASLFVRKVKVSPGVLLGHAKVVQSTSARYPIDRILCKMYSISNGSFSFSQDNVFLGQMLKRLIITCVDNDAFNGTYSSNPFYFKHNNLNFLCVYVDGNRISSQPLEPDYSNDQSIRAFNSLLVGSGKLASNKVIYINKEEFVQGYTLYAFDLTPDLCDGSHLNLVNKGNLRIE